jgi:hypothetical protein
MIILSLLGLVSIVIGIWLLAEVCIDSKKSMPYEDNWIAEIVGILGICFGLFIIGVLFL